MFSKYIKYTKGTIRLFSKVHFHFVKALPNSKHSPSWMAPSFLWRHGWTSKVSFYNRVRHEGVFSTAVVCWSRHDFFTYSTDSNKSGHTMQIFPNDANLKRQFVKFVQVKIADFVEPFERSVVCSSHFSSWWCTDDSGLTRSKLFGSIKTTHTVGRRRGFGSGRPNWERSWALQKLEVNRESTKSIYMKTFR